MLDAVPRDAVDEIAEQGRVNLLGVRHHSPALAVAMPALLAAANPDALLVELPAEMQPWLTWLADPQTTAPVALAAAGDGDDQLMGFYPFADFSPELAALRWAHAHNVPAYCCDLPLTDPAWTQRPDPGPRRAGPTLASLVARQLTGRDDDDLWDRWVEAPAPGSPPQAIRRAALAAGWALRHDAQAAGGVPELDLRREAWMRQCIYETPGTLAVVVGAFHAPALTSIAVAGSTMATGEPTRAAPLPGPVVSLVPFTFELLDARSGYPAGIRDPRWQQSVYESGGDPQRQASQAQALAVEVARAVRAQGHPAGPAEAAEVVRLAGDLARLRNLPAPGRGELVEALQTVLAQGEPVGRGRIVAEAMRHTLIGERGGRLAAGTPVSGLLPAVTAQLADLKLPGPKQKATTVRLDPLRSPLDRSRELFLQRLSVCAVRYGETQDSSGETLTTVWRLHWTPATDASLAVAALHGVTLEQAAHGLLSLRRQRERSEGGPTAAQTLTGLAQAASCGIAELTTTRLAEVHSTVCQAGSLDEIIAALELVLRLQRGHFPGLAEAPEGIDDVRDNLYAAAVSSAEGLAGSTRLPDARALTGLVHHLAETGRLLRLEHVVTEIAKSGSPLMRGAAAAVCVLLGIHEPAGFGARLVSWVELPGAECTARLQGAMTAAGALLQSSGDALNPLIDRIGELDDDTFIQRLPALRGGFDALSPADRQRLLETVTGRSGQFDDTLTASPQLIAAWMAADRAGLAAVTALGLNSDPAQALGAAAKPKNGAEIPATIAEIPVNNARQPAENAEARANDAGALAISAAAPANSVGAAERWRLLLGREPEQLSGTARRLATALDELYGAGQGEGAHQVDRGGRGGKERAYPQARDWLEDLQALFGNEIRDEIIARAAEAGRADAVLAVDPSSVRPSMELLHTVLTLAGGLPEARLAQLRPLVARLVAELTAQLARQMRPALTGLGISRRTRRPTGLLDLAATIQANLHTVRTTADNKRQVVPDRLIFRSRGRRSVEWQIILVVDVSGSMEESTIWAALTSAVLAGVPALRTHFVTFSTEVIDLTDRVTDPLSLLLEISVGGGTHIAAGLRYARQIVTTPSRTMVVVISDFEEGFPVAGLLAAVRALADDGVTLLGCASLDDRGQPRYSTGIAGQLVAAGMPIAALSPLALARWVGEQVR